VGAAIAPNPITVENTCPGTTTWQTNLPTGPANAIMGFTAPDSVSQGQVLQLFVSTAASAYRFEIYRMGWYQGYGGRLVYTSPSLAGVNQPAPQVDATTRMVSANNWRDPVRITIPATWVSGVYVIKLISADGYMRYTPFVVRDDASRAQILIAIPFLTYQAYNTWGGTSLYSGSDSDGEQAATARAYTVSFDRPYSGAAGLGNFPMYDQSTLEWFERMGYDVSYIADSDLGTLGAALDHHRLIVLSGKVEYWSTAMRAAITAARDAGVSLGFFGGDDVYWHVRLRTSALGANRQVVCYKSAALDPLAALDPKEATVRWRDPPLNEPEGTLMGAMYTGIYLGANGLPLKFAADAAALLVGTGLKAGDSLPGLVGVEVDAAFHPAGDQPLHTLILATTFIPGHYTSQNVCSACGHTAAMTLYTAPSGARIFDAGTLRLAWGFSTTVSPSFPATPRSAAAFQRFMENLIAYLLRAPIVQATGNTSYRSATPGRPARPLAQASSASQVTSSPDAFRTRYEAVMPRTNKWAMS
jgi:hypothetical protein